MSKLEKIGVLVPESVGTMSEEAFSIMADQFINQRAYGTEMIEICQKLERLRILDSLGGTIKYEDGDPVLYVDLTGDNLKAIMETEEGT